MEIDGNVEFLGSFKEGPIRNIIVEMALVMVVDQGANKTKLFNTSSQLAHFRISISKAGETKGSE